jgi:hypothetical protein
VVRCRRGDSLMDLPARTWSSTTACWRCSTSVNWAWWLPGTPGIPRAAGICRIAAVSTARWPAKVLDPALPGRSSMASDPAVLASHGNPAGLAQISARTCARTRARTRATLSRVAGSALTLPGHRQPVIPLRIIDDEERSCPGHDMVR